MKTFNFDVNNGSLRITPQNLGVIHFVGIGGIGMSGIASILHNLGYQVRGSDLSDNYNVKRLQTMGIRCFIGQKAEQVDGAAVIVISSDINDNNPEIKEARKQKLPIVRRAEMLAEIMRLRPSIAVAGTHGKTTTTSLGAYVLDHAGVDPTVISGGIINAYGTNARLGRGEWTIVEADESDGTFTKLPATIAIVTNIDPEHMSFYGTEEKLYQAFKTYVENIPFYGLAIVCADHPVCQKLMGDITDRRLVSYGLTNDADIFADQIKMGEDGLEFRVNLSPKALQLFHMDENAATTAHFTLSMVGTHNVQNALSIIACGLEIGLNFEQMKKGFATFEGVKRRFSPVGTWQDIHLIDDYGHHPAEIQAVLKAARTVSKGRVVAVMQPHRYSRFNDLFNDFAQSFKDADQVLITPVYAAGEQEPQEGRTSDQLVELLNRDNREYARFAETPLHIIQWLETLGKQGDYVIFLGAGDITYWAQEVFKALSDKSSDRNIVLNNVA